MGLDAVEIVMDVEDHFGIVIDDDEAGRMRTVGDLVALIRSRVDLPDDSAILNELRAIVADVLGIDTGKVAFDARFVEDLGVG